MPRRPSASRRPVGSGAATSSSASSTSRFAQRADTSTVLVAPNDAGIARLGIVASRKLGDAVRRNRAKRLIREVFRRIRPAAAWQGSRRGGHSRDESCSMPCIPALNPICVAQSSAAQPDFPPPPMRALICLAAQRLALRADYRLYKLLISPIFAGSCRYLPSCSDYAARSRSPIRRPSRVCPGGPPARALPPARRPRLRRSPCGQPEVSIVSVHGKAGSDRGHPVVHRPVRLPGDVPAAEAGDINARQPLRQTTSPSTDNSYARGARLRASRAAGQQRRRRQPSRP